MTVTVDGTAGDQVALRVSNRGGMPESVRARLFDPFRARERGSPASEGGLGLGLYIAQQVVLAHHGQIELLPGQEQTTFLIRLPRHAPTT